MKVGIDLGTTNSLVSLWTEDGSKLVPNVFGDLLTPSVVGFDDSDQLIVGKPAKERLLTHPQLTTAHFKRYMGSAKAIKVGSRSFRPEELSSFILRSLIDDVQREHDVEISEAVITVPAYFNDKQRRATKVAGELAGLQVDRLFNEPTAAALTYGVHEQADDAKFVVVDLGGGTFDVSVLDMFDGIVEVLGSGGDNYLGGEDFTTALAELIHKELCQNHEVLKTDLHATDARVVHLAEQAKRSLNQENQVDFSLTITDQSFAGTVTKAQYMKAIEPLLSRLTKPITQTLRDSKLNPKDITHVVMVGGASRMVPFRQELTRLFGLFPHTDTHPDHSIAIGCGVFIGLIEEDVKLEEVVLTDVMPYTLGIEISKTDFGLHSIPGYYMPIIERNQHVPISRVESVATIHDDQEKLAVKIYQGERPIVEDNILIGSLEVPIPKSPAGRESADIRFSYDTNGILEVEVTIYATHLMGRGEPSIKYGMVILALLFISGIKSEYC